MNNTQRPETVTFPEPDPRLTGKPSLKKYLRYLTFFGPGAVLASMTIGQGQLILAPQLGAWSGYAFLWIITLTLGSFIIAYAGCRFTLISGLSTMSVFSLVTRKSWINWIFILIIVIFIPMFTASIITTLGQSLNWIFGGGHYLLWGISFSLFAAMLVLAGKYKILEISQAFFVVVLGLGAVIAVIKIQPSLTGMLPNFFRFGNIPAYPEWLLVNFPNSAKTPVKLLMLGLMGTLAVSIIPLVGYMGWLKVKNWGIFRGQDDPDQFSHQLFQRYRAAQTIDYLPTDESNMEKARYFGKPLAVDLGVAFFLVALVSVCYMTAGKFLLGPQPDGTYRFPTNVNLLKEQAVIFSHIGRMLVPLYKVSIIFALFGTIYAGFEAVARMLFETTREMNATIRHMNYNRFLIYLMVYILCTGVPLAILIYNGFSVLMMLSITLLFIGVVGVIIYGIGILIINQRILPPPYRLKTGGFIIVLLGILGMSLPLILAAF